MKRLLGALFIIIPSCLPFGEGGLYEPLGLTVEHRYLLQYAASRWCESPLACCWIDNLGAPAEVSMLVRYGTRQDCIRTVKRHCSGYEGRGEIVLIPETIPDDRWMYAVMLHELGHACGCRHADVGLMKSTPDDIDVDTAAQLCIRAQ